MGFFESFFRLGLALLPIERNLGDGHQVTDGDWETAARELPNVLVSTIQLLPGQYSKQALEAVRARLKDLDG